MRASLEHRVRTLQPGKAVPFLAVLLEVIWSYPWLVWASGWQTLGWTAPPLSLASAVFLAVAGEVLARFALRRDWSLFRVRLTVLVALIIVLSATIRIDQGGGYALWDPNWFEYAREHLSALAGGLAFGVFLVWRGITIGRESLPIGDLYPKFAFGLAALVLLIVVSSMTSGSAILRHDKPMMAYVVAYFASGLLGMALVNLQAMQEQIRRQEDSAGILQRRWLSMLVALVLGIVAVSLAIASLFSFDLLGLLIHPLGVAANWLFTVLIYVIAYPLGLVAAALIYVIRFLIHLFGGGQPPEPIRAPDFSDLENPEAQTITGIPPEVVLALKWGFLALLAVLVIFFLARALFRYQQGKPEADLDEISESLWSLGAFRNDLGTLFSWLLRWLRRRKLLAGAIIPKKFIKGGESGNLLTVREVYRALLRQGREAGLPRRPAETPYEYREKFERDQGKPLPQVEVITEAYVQERYGDIVTGHEDLHRLNTLWRDLLSMLRNSD